MGEIACWHCGYPLPAGPDGRPARYAGIPTGRTGYLLAGEARARYELHGYFHDPQCARAFLEDHPRCHRYRALFKAYVEEVWCMRLPPPAMSKVLLEAYGGAFSWRDWKAASLRSADAWRLTDLAVEAGASIGRALLEQSQVSAVPDMLAVDPEAELNQPGSSTAMASLVDWR